MWKYRAQITRPANLGRKRLVHTYPVSCYLIYRRLLEPSRRSSTVKRQHYYWAIAERIGPMAVSFFVSILIARIVGPAAYGLVAMLGIFMALGQAFSELGLGSALVQRKDITTDDETTCFILNITAGATVTIILALASPFVARFFNQPDLFPLLCVQSLNIFVASTSLVQFALLTRQMKFHLGAIIELVATTISGTIGVVMAYTGYGVWSLVALGLSREFSRAVLAWTVVGWRPHGRFSMVRLAVMWKYCSKLLYSSLLHRVAMNINTVVIGKIFPPAALGFYGRAAGLQALPVGVVTGVIQRVTFPLFSLHQDNKVLLLELIRKKNRLLVLIVSVMMGLLALLASELVPWMLGPHWSGSVRLLEILCLAGVFSSAFPLHSEMIAALGESSIFFKVEVIKKAAIFVVLASVYHLGLEAFAWGAVIVSVFDYLLSSYPNRKLIGYSLKMQFFDLVPPLFLSVTVSVFLMNLPWVESYSPLALMSLKFLSFASLFLFGAFVFRRIFFRDAWELFFSRGYGD